MSCNCNNNCSSSCSSCNSCRGPKGEPGRVGPQGPPGPPGSSTTVDYYTAYAGGGQTDATNLISTDNIVNVAATLGDSVKLLPAVKNTVQQVRNYGVSAIYIYPQSGEQINSAGVNVPYPLAAGSTVSLSCPIDGNYID